MTPFAFTMDMFECTSMTIYYNAPLHFVFGFLQLHAVVFMRDMNHLAASFVFILALQRYMGVLLCIKSWTIAFLGLLYISLPLFAVKPVGYQSCLLPLYWWCRYQLLAPCSCCLLCVVDISLWMLYITVLPCRVNVPKLCPCPCRFLLCAILPCVSHRSVLVDESLQHHSLVCFSIDPSRLMLFCLFVVGIDARSGTPSKIVRLSVAFASVALVESWDIKLCVLLVYGSLACMFELGLALR